MATHLATHLATHFTRRETNDGNGWRRLDIQERRWNLARRDRHRARQGHRAQAAAHGPRQDQGGGERAPGLHPRPTRNHVTTHLSTGLHPDAILEHLLIFEDGVQHTLLRLFVPIPCTAIRQNHVTSLTTHMLDAVRNLLMATMNHRALNWITQIPASTLRHVALAWIGIAALRALEPSAPAL